MREVVFGLGGFDPSKPSDNIVDVIEFPEAIVQPLSDIGVIATLNVVLGLWSLQDAANATNISPDALVAEAEAWAAAST